MKILYYITDHGLGHASRSVALVRELKNHAQVVIRNDDRYRFLARSLPDVEVISGRTDFEPAMQKENSMLIDDAKTQANISDWLDSMPETIERELEVVRKQRPDLIVSDISIMPLMAGRKAGVRSAAISNFTWSETLTLDEKSREFFVTAYSQADLVVRLPLGTEMRYPNRINVGLVARKTTIGKTEIRRQLGLATDKKLVVVAVSGAGKIAFDKENDIEVLDISDYETAMKLKELTNFVEGQNLIGAADLVICKCGYGFVSECLSTGTRFRYVVEAAHREANEIHRFLERQGLKNRIEIGDLKEADLDTRFIENSPSLKMDLDNDNVAGRLLELASGS